MDPEWLHYRDANLRRWDDLVAVHERAYGIEAFRAGASSLTPLEVAEVGEVGEKRLLHLQCHFGLDTLSWARLGATVIGLDFSAKAIDLASQLADERDIPAEFVCSDVYDAAANVDGQFDVVVTSYGVLCWLPDLRQWAEMISQLLAPGGFFYIVEQHPIGSMFLGSSGELVARHAYFNTGAIEETGQGSYADPSAVLEHPTSFEWQHSLSDIINAVVGAGLRIDFLHEFPICRFQWLSVMEQGEDGWWRVPGRDDVPFLFSLKASKAEFRPRPNVAP
jgi:2-polyprenyl-3-methyl-5-hydroxy-6-metoxy-1,4-benzoquinol methylase